MDFQKFITCEPSVCGGVPVIAGTRVPVRTVLASLENGDTAAEILADFPGVSELALRAVVAFAAASAKEDLPVPRLAS